MATPIKTEIVRPSESDMRSAVAINSIALQTEYVQLPSTMHRYIKIKTAAAKALRLAELDDEVEIEKIRISIREADEAANKRRTIDEVKAAVITSQRYRASKEKVIDAEEKKDEAAGMVDVLRDKRDMLVSLGADVRADKQSGISINEQPRKR